jgi:hypothetical protein
MNVLQLKNRWDSLNTRDRALGIHPIAHDPESLENVLHVPMENIAAVNAHDKKYMIGTTDLYSCLGVALYDSASKVGAVAHIKFDFKEYQRNKGDFNLFGRVPEQVDELLGCAKKKGGLNFDGIIINLASVWRSRHQNQDLQILVKDALAAQSIPIKAIYNGKDPMEFKLDSKTGLITPYWQ